MDVDKIVFILLLCGIGVMIGLFSCSLPDRHVESDPDPEPGISVNLKSDEVEIIKIRDCDFVFWENPRGLDMEHYAGCMNPAHTAFHEDSAKGMRLNWEDEGKIFHINPNHTLLPKPKKEAGK